MQIIHRVDRHDNGNMKSEVVVYNFQQSPTDIWQRIHDAILDYCTTPEGRQRAESGGMTTYDDFLDFVPDDICNRHGLERIMASNVAQHIPTQAIVVDKREIVRTLRQLDREQEREEAIQRIIPQLAKAMADMQSLAPKTDKWSFWQIANTSVKWSVEYVDSGESDLRGFVRRKLDALTAPKSKTPA